MVNFLLGVLEEEEFRAFLHLVFPPSKCSSVIEETLIAKSVAVGLSFLARGRHFLEAGPSSRPVLPRGRHSLSLARFRHCDKSRSHANVAAPLSLFAHLGAHLRTEIVRSGVSRSRYSENDPRHIDVGSLQKQSGGPS